MDIIRKKLEPVGTGTNPQRYDDTTGEFQTYIGGEWVNSPDADPRYQQLTPPIDSAYPRCDAAARMTAYVQDTIQGIIDDLQASATAFTIFSGIYLLLGIFGGLWALFAALVSEIVAVASAAGYTDMSNNFDTDFYDRLLCYFYCHIPTSGVLTADGLQAVIDDLGGESSTIQNVMGALFALTGTAILNGMAAERSETGDCDGCTDCEWCYQWPFGIDDGGWYADTLNGHTAAAYDSGVGWGTVDINNGPGSYSRISDILFDLPATAEMTEITITFDLTKGSWSANNTLWAIYIDGVAKSSDVQGNYTNGTYTRTWTGDVSGDQLRVFVRSSLQGSASYSGFARILQIRVKGVGDNPFETSNC